MLVRNASPEGPMCFRRQMFSLSGPCELLCLLVFFCLLDLSCCECDVISLHVMCCSANGYACPVCCVSDSVCELFGQSIRIVFGCGHHFPIECSKECASCACDLSVHLSVSSICFGYVCVC